MNEQTARAMTLTELAQRLADEHTDPVVVHFAKRVIDLNKWLDVVAIANSNTAKNVSEW